jgi:hypothetical protein
MPSNVSRLILLTLLAASTLHAQQQGGFLGLGGNKDDKPHFAQPLPYKIFHLASISQPADANEIINAIRRVIVSDSVTLLTPQNDLLIIGSPEQLKAAEDLIQTLDKPHPLQLYHLAFTVTETNGSQIAVRHYALQALPGENATLKATRWIQLTPPPTPVNEKGQPLAQPKIEHIELGMTFDVTLSELQGGLRMHSHIANSLLPPDTAPAGTEPPIVEENELDTTTLLRFNKPILLGVIDPPNTNKHIEIQVTADQPNTP